MAAPAHESIKSKSISLSKSAATTETEEVKLAPFVKKSSIKLNPPPLSACNK